MIDNWTLAKQGCISWRKKYDFYVNILSNLTLLNDEIIAEMKAGNVSSVQVSLYSMNPEHHDAITAVKGSLEKTKAAILKLVENMVFSLHYLYIFVKVYKFLLHYSKFS